MSDEQLVASFQIAFRACIDADGNALRPLPEFVEDASLLRRMYQMMVRARTFDAKAINLQRTGKLGTYASGLGHEAAHVGIGGNASRRRAVHGIS